MSLAVEMSNRVYSHLRGIACAECGHENAEAMASVCDCCNLAFTCVRNVREDDPTRTALVVALRGLLKLHDAWEDSLRNSLPAEVRGKYDVRFSAARDALAKVGA